MVMSRDIFIGLNVARALSIVALLLLFASSIVTLVYDIEAVNAFVAAGSDNHLTSANSTSTNASDCDDPNIEYVPGSTVPNQPAGAFWAVLNRLLIIFQAVVLLLSELGWPIGFFDRFFPVLGSNFGLGALGVIQCLLGAAVLSHFVDEFALVAAFFLFALGCVNVFLGLVFRENAKRHRHLSRWHGRRRPAASALSRSVTGTTAVSVGWADEKGLGYSGGADAARSGSQRSGMGFGRQGEKVALQRGATLTRPQEAVPPYVGHAYAPARPARPVSVASEDGAV
ncbi:hypothetical protein B0H21DRAFT_779629 [Amylocystis lapponica]|nr:hypothetical protein B0H21DRAFT_779629 [Amylocystis lapponica]